MKKYERKTTWHRALRTEAISKDQDVKMWVLPHGVICELTRIGGLPILRNGNYDAVNSFLAKTLLDAGIENEVLFYTTRVIPQTLSRWLTHWLSTDPSESDPELSSVTVTTMGQYPQKPLPFQVNVVEPILVKAGAVFDIIKQKSRNNAVSQFIVEANGESYRLEPVRNTTGKIIDCTEYGYVVRTPTGHTFLATMISRRIQSQLKHHNVRPDDLIGTEVKIEYTMFTEGTRLCNYKSSIIFRSYALDNLGDSYPASYDGPNPFKPLPGGSNPALLTVTRCGRADIVQKDGVIYGVERESGETLFKFEPGVSRGMYAAQFENKGQTETWRFVSEFAVDAIDPTAFVESVATQVFGATGYSLQRLGLCYAETAPQSMET